MRNRLLPFMLLLTMLVGRQEARAQYYFFDDTYFSNDFLYEAGFSVNAMNCLTDMGGKRGIGKKYLKDLNLGYTNLSGGVFFSVIWKNAIALRIEGTFGKISSDDKILKGITDIAKERFNRNLSFRSNISEVSVLAEIHPMYIFIDWPAKETTPPRFSPYISGGIGYFSFNPQTKLGNRFVDLQPLHTEGQGFPEYPQNKNYKLNQIMIPLGGGVKYELSPLMNVRAEFLYRKLFTDYLDDLSSFYIDPQYFSKYLSGAKLTNAMALYNKQIEQRMGIDGKRGTRTNNDGYFTIGIKVSVIIGRDRIKRYG